MSETYIVMVADREDSKHGEISVTEDAEAAERLVETLLEAGFEPSRIRVFSGRASEFAISHRPVVALVGDEDAPAEATTAPVFAAEPATERAAEETVGTPVETVTAAEEQPVEQEAVAAAAEGPVRFSSLFRSA
jgi:hypothetical protein